MFEDFSVINEIKKELTKLRSLGDTETEAVCDLPVPQGTISVAFSMMDVELKNVLCLATSNIEIGSAAWAVMDEFLERLNRTSSVEIAADVHKTYIAARVHQEYDEFLQESDLTLGVIYFHALPRFILDVLDLLQMIEAGASVTEVIEIHEERLRTRLNSGRVLHLDDLVVPDDPSHARINEDTVELLRKIFPRMAS